MFEVIICDDNIEYAKYEKDIIEDILKGLGVTSSNVIIYDNGQKLLKEQELLKDCNLLLMDVEMDGKNGIDVLSEMDYLKNTVVVIVSSFIDYALEGYKVNAYRYLLKSSKNFKDGMQEVVEHGVEICADENQAKLSFEFREGSVDFGIDEIIYIESKLHYTYFHLMKDGFEKIYSLRSKLDDVEHKIQSDDLIRIHKSQLVNAKYITDIKRYEVVLSGGEKLRVSQRKYDEAVLKYADYVGENNV